jgi:hypothetical protein
MHAFVLVLRITGSVQICSFLTAYQILSDGNRLAVLGSFDESVPCLYSDLNVLTEPDAPRATNSGAVHVANGLKRILGASLCLQNQWSD